MTLEFYENTTELYLMSNTTENRLKKFLAQSSK